MQDQFIAAAGRLAVAAAALGEAHDTHSALRLAAAVRDAAEDFAAAGDAVVHIPGAWFSYMLVERHCELSLRQLREGEGRARGRVSPPGAGLLPHERDRWRDAEAVLAEARRAVMDLQGRVGAAHYEAATELRGGTGRRATAAA